MGGGNESKCAGQTIREMAYIRAASAVDDHAVAGSADCGVALNVAINEKLVD